jgi:hypothetical protein
MRHVSGELRKLELNRAAAMAAYLLDAVLEVVAVCPNPPLLRFEP